MTRMIVLLRAVNLAGRNRIAMPELRTALAEAGFDDVRTLLQSGNVVLTSRKSASSLAREIEHVIEGRFGLTLDVVVRTRDELAKLVKRNPLKKIATDPKRHLVTFLAAKPDPGVVAELESLAAGGEKLVLAGRELHAWYPNGAGRSKLAMKLSGGALGVAGTARNWATVTKLLALADE